MNRSLWAGSLKVYLGSLIILLLIGVAIPLIWLGYDRGRNAAVAAAHEQIRILSDRAVDRYRIVFGSAVPIVAMAAASEALAAAPPADITAKWRFLLKGLKSSPYLDGIYAGYPDGSFVHAVSLENNGSWRDVLHAPPNASFALRIIAPEATGVRLSTWYFLGGGGQIVGALDPVAPNYDPRERPWYKLALAASGPILIRPYVTATTKTLAVTLSERLDAHPGIIAGADILLTTIAEFIAREKVSPGGSAYILDESGTLIIHSDPAVMDRLLATMLQRSSAVETDLRIDDPVLDNAKAALGGAANDRVAQFNVGGKPYIGSVSPIRFSSLLEGNTLLIAAPLSDFTGPSEKLLEEGLVISGLLLFAGILVALVVARLITRSLSGLTSEAGRLADLEFEGFPLQHSRIKEINSLAGALEIARDAIRTFALYVPRELVRKIISSSQRLAGAAVRQDVTVLFTDIRDFTTICERHRPEDVVAMLSAYFELMNEGVERNHGTIIQFLGDSIYAMWNAPVNDPLQVVHACRCALDLAAAVEVFNVHQRKAAKPEFITRFGLHTGQAVVGSVGALSRLQYTAMGDTVNVASRLEGINKEFGTTIIVSREVSDRASEFEFRPLGLWQAKGRSEKIEIFELVAAR